MTVYVLSSYRLAPEYPFPVPFDDCVRATVYFLHHAAEMGVDPARVAIAGSLQLGSVDMTIHSPSTWQKMHDSIQGGPKK